jgi:hypothetical protein
VKFKNTSVILPHTGPNDMNSIHLVQNITAQNNSTALLVLDIGELLTTELPPGNSCFSHGSHHKVFPFCTPGHLTLSGSEGTKREAPTRDGGQEGLSKGNRQPANSQNSTQNQANLSRKAQNFVKAVIVDLACWGLLQVPLASWLIQRGGLRHA